MRLIGFLFWWLCALGLQAQSVQVFPDSASAVRQVQALREAGFLAASVDSLWQGDSSWTALVYQGPLFTWTSPRNGSVPPLIWQQAAAGKRQKANPAQLRERILQAAENAGYPLARVWIDSLSWQDSVGTATFFMETGPLVRLDTLIWSGDARIASGYLESYLGLRAGQVFSRKQLEEARARLDELPFLTVEGTPRILVRRDGAAVAFDLKRRKASRFDFLIGILPTADPTLSRRILLTGTINAELLNPFGWGERLYLSFEQLRPGTQELELAAGLPYLLRLPFGADAAFSQYKRDSTYSDVLFDAGVRFSLPGGNFGRVFWNSATSNLLQINQEVVVQTRNLPEFLDVRTRSLGLEYVWLKLDYRLNPQRGWGFQVRALAGRRTVQPNNLISELVDPADPEFDFSSLYDTLAQPSYLYRLSGRLEKYTRLFPAGVLVLQVRGGWVYSSQNINRNEQFRIGGNRLLRGFDEESLFVSAYGLGTAEFRLILDRNSHLFAFADLAFIQDCTRTANRTDWPMGLGAGISFDTRGGILGLSLATGRQQGAPFDLRNPKVHIGYVNYF